MEQRAGKWRKNLLLLLFTNNHRNSSQRLTTTKSITLGRIFLFSKVGPTFWHLYPPHCDPTGACPVMGSCLGSCAANESHTVAPSCLWRRSRDDQDAELISIASNKCRQKNFIYRILKFKSKRRRSQFMDQFWQRQDLQYAQLTTKSASDSLTDIQLQNLDVNNLLSATSLAEESALNCVPAVNSSRASSSLDLEWEHEYAQTRHYATATVEQHQMHQKTTSSNHSTANGAVERRKLSHGSCGSTYGGGPTLAKANGTTQNSWSHISTPESLEWDIDEEQQSQLRVEDDRLDHETLALLHQIEQLKNQVLHETGDGCFENGHSSCADEKAISYIS